MTEPRTAGPNLVRKTAIAGVHLTESGKVEISGEMSKSVALIFLPLKGQVIAKLPARKGNFQWLHRALKVRSPKLEGDRWTLPRTCLTRLVRASIDRFGYVALVRDMSKLSRCDRRCLEADGSECQCTCLGLHHGENAHAWIDAKGTSVVADLGENKRSLIVYGNKAGIPGDYRRLYDGELYTVKYSVMSKDRKSWPAIHEFMCASCLTEPATVWDHCHTHGWVRAPLCNKCNTRHWAGWRPELGRTRAAVNVDLEYYDWCPDRDAGYEWGECSP